MKPFALLACAAAVLMCGCEESPPTTGEVPIPVAKATPQPTTAEGPAPTEKLLGGVTITIPAGWQERPANEFILADYRISAASGEARVTMSSTKGGVEANLDRWRSQFTRQADDAPPSESSITVDGQTATLIELSGTFRDMFNNTEEPHWSLVGVAIPTGPATFFVKLTGPRETVAAHREELLEMVKSARLAR